MYLRKLKNRTGSISVQIISKSKGRYKVLKTIGCGSSEQEIQRLLYLGKQEIEKNDDATKIICIGKRYVSR